MKQEDRVALQEMQREIARGSEGGILGEIAERLLRLRDRLCFDDDEWYHQLTQHVATLDSASTFRSSVISEQHQVASVVQAAIGEIKELICIKLK